MAAGPAEGRAREYKALEDNSAAKADIIKDVHERFCLDNSNSRFTSHGHLAKEQSVRTPFHLYFFFFATIISYSFFVHK